MNSKPLISIITVSYNAKEPIAVTIDSVKRQVNVTPGVDFEYIVMDGGSTDGTVQVALNSNIPNAKIISERDGGIYDAMNKAMDIASGDYYMFLNAGDALHAPHTLSNIVATIKANEMPGVVYGQTNLVDNNRKFIAPRHLTAPPELHYTDFAEGMLVCHQAFVALARIAPHYNLKYRLSADFDWCIQVLQHSRHNVYIPEVLIDYLFEGASTKNRVASLKERFKIMCFYFGTFPTIKRHFRFISRFISHSKKIKQSTK